MIVPVLRRRRRSGLFVPVPLAFDSFDRPNNATTLGTSDSGHVWTNQVSVMGIENNRAYRPSGTGDSFATMDVGQADVAIEVSLPILATPPQIGRIVIRYVDANDWVQLVLREEGDFYSLSQNDNGTVSNLGNSAILAAPGERLRVECEGPNIIVRINGQVAIVGSPTIHTTSTLFGIGTSGSPPTGTLRFDDWVVYPI